MNVRNKAATAVASSGRKSRVASVVFVILALVPPSLAVRAPVARAQSWGEVVLNSFDETDGQYSFAGVIQGGDGNFYGTTEYGGANPAIGNLANAAGSVFKLKPSGELTTLYLFCSVHDPTTGFCLDGFYPYAGVIQGSDGNFYGTTLLGGGANQNSNQYGHGTVFKLTPSGALTTLYSFCTKARCTDGSTPFAGVIQGSDGNLYGTTFWGGAHDNGMVFKLTLSGTLTILHSFCSKLDCADGKWPYAGVIEGNDGNFYGTTYGGGANPNRIKNGPGTVFKLTPSGKLTTLHSFCSVFDPHTHGCRDGRWPFAGVIQGSGGNFYGTTEYGGVKGRGTIFKLTPPRKLITIHSFCRKADCTDGALPSAGVIQASDGNFYGTTEHGGPNDAGTAFRLTPSGELTTLYSFCSQARCTDGANPYAGLLESGDRNLYGTTSYGGADGLGIVFQLTPSDTPPTSR